MAYDFTLSSFQSLSGSNTFATGAPLTVAGWVNRKVVPASAQQVVVALSNITSGSTNFFNLGSTQNGGINFIANVNGTAYSAFSETSPYGANTWNHLCGVARATNNRESYVNGTFRTNNFTNAVPIGINSIQIGARWGNTSNGQFMNGRLAEIGVWNIDLTSQEVASLAKGIACNKIRPQNLVFYAPLISNFQDLKGGRTLTPINNPTIFSHTRVYM